MRKWTIGIAVVLVVAGLWLVGSPAAAQGTMTQMSGTFSGAAEVPGPGDADGAGTASLTVDTSKNEVCYTLNVSAITLPAAATHIHEGAVGVSGPVVIPFPTAPDANGAATGCATADAAVISALVANPANYYVNVHTSDFPNGAVRAQLAVAAAPPAMPTTGSARADWGLPLVAAGATLLLAVALLRRARVA